MIARLSLAALLAAGVGYVSARVARAPRCPWCDRRHWLRCATQVDAERADSTCHEPTSERCRHLRWDLADGATYGEPWDTLRCFECGRLRIVDDGDDYYETCGQLQLAADLPTSHRPFACSLVEDHDGMHVAKDSRYGVLAVFP